MESTNETSPQGSRARTSLMASARRSLLKAAIMATLAVAFISAAPDRAWAAFGVKPIVNCVTFDEFSNQIIVYWGFDNTNSFEITIDNSFNFFVPGPSNRDQPITFAPGRNDYAFTTVSDAGTAVTWVLGEFFATAIKDLNLYCTRVGPAVGQPVLSPAAITVQAGAPLQSFTIATVSSGSYQASQISVGLSPASGVPQLLTVSNITNTNGVVTAAISADTALSPGQYGFVLDASIGPLDATASVIVNVTAACQGPVVAPLPASVQGCSGTPLTLSVSATGSGLSYQWRKNGQPINGATSATFKILSPSSSDSGSYDVIVTGSCGTATSTATSVSVGAPPTLTAQPTAQAASSGGSVIFTAAASGTPAPTIQWQVSTDGGTSFSNVPGATSASLQVAASPGIDDSLYRAVFSNLCGTVTTQAAAVIVFDKCLRSDTSGDHVQFNTTTGEYLFTHCGPGGFTLSGKGVISIASGAIVIIDQKADRLVKISYLPNQLTGKVSLSFAAVAGVWSSFVINATNPNAPCSCM